MSLSNKLFALLKNIAKDFLDSGVQAETSTHPTNTYLPSHTIWNRKIALDESMDESSSESAFSLNSFDYMAL